jgi:hypothetical protein
MPKYYIKSGDCKIIIDRDSHRLAICAVLKKAKENNIQVSKKICVSEKGFLVFKECICYDTKEYLRDL